MSDQDHSARKPVTLEPALENPRRKKRRLRNRPRSTWAEQAKLLQAEIAEMPSGPARDGAQKRLDKLTLAVEIEGLLKPG